MGCVTVLMYLCILITTRLAEILDSDWSVAAVSPKEGNSAHPLFNVLFFQMCFPINFSHRDF